MGVRYSRARVFKSLSIFTFLINKDLRHQNIHCLKGYSEMGSHILMRDI